MMYWKGRKEGKKEGRKEGRKEESKKRRTEGRKEGTKEGKKKGKNGSRHGLICRMKITLLYTIRHVRMFQEHPLPSFSVQVALFALRMNSANSSEMSANTDQTIGS
jgi:hypothetical protein